jgi:protein-disulfide isomerase
MKKQMFVRGAWRRAGRSRWLRLALILVVAVSAGVMAGRALSEKADPGKPAAPERPAPSAQGSGSTVTQVVQAPGSPAADPGFIKEIPNTDFSGLTPAQKEEAIKILNERRCVCNCNMNLAQCRRDDKSCPRSPEIVARFLAAIKKGDTPSRAAEKMYGEAGAAPVAQAVPPPGTGPAAAAAPAAPPAGNDKLFVFKVDPGSSPSVGPKSAPVTIVEFLDFQCPFCARGDQTVQRILAEYKDKVRVVFKQHPLAAIHPQAALASEAALAAHEQGRYLEMHKKIFSVPGALSQTGNDPGPVRERLTGMAREIGLDEAKFKTSLNSGKHRTAIEADTKLAESLGATGTPAFFINGRFLSGARPFEQFKEVIDQEIAGKRPTFEWGTHVSQLRGREEAEEAKRRQDEARRRQEDEKKVYQVDLKNAVSTGTERAAVTIVEFTDFQCPFCQKVQPALKQLLQDYKGKLRLVTKNLPLAFHPQARPAARAALAAHRQGKYWEYRDLVFANNRTISEQSLLGHAQTLGLNLDRFRADMASPEIDQIISTDEQTAQEIGATGTPTFLINGRKLVGAVPLEAFKQRIDAELAAKPGSAGGR